MLSNGSSRTTTDARHDREGIAAIHTAIDCQNPAQSAIPEHFLASVYVRSPHQEHWFFGPKGVNLLGGAKLAPRRLLRIFYQVVDPFRRTEEGRVRVD